MFEIEATRYVPANYEWRLNKNNNFEGYERRTGSHCFTWQSSGSQFTVFHHVPASAYRFRINRTPGLIEEHYVLQLVRFKDSWIEAVPNPLND